MRTPRAALAEISREPPSASICVRTTCKPTPRPERSVTRLLVENPGAVSTSSTASLESRAARNASSGTPRPSSATVTAIVRPRCSAVSSMRPARGFPACSRSSGRSIPCATELRRRFRRVIPNRSVPSQCLQSCAIVLTPQQFLWV